MSDFEQYSQLKKGYYWHIRYRCARLPKDGKSLDTVIRWTWGTLKLTATQS